VRVPSQAPTGRHEIRITWDFPQRKVPERVFTFDVDNPDFGKPVVDPDAEDLRRKYPDAVTAVLQQGLPCDALGIDSYQGCADVWMNSENSNHGRSRILKTGTYKYDNVALIRFDLARLPKGAKVEAAILKLRTMNGGSATNRLAYRMLRSWEAGTGFNGEERKGLLIENMTGGGTAPKDGECGWLCAKKPDQWGSAGASQPGVDRDAAVLAEGREIPDAVPSPAKGERRAWIAWSVTSAAKGWAENPASNCGVLLDGRAGKDGKKGFCEFSSAECIDPLWRPKLILTYRKE
jgi:hypothetical protein